MKRLIGMATVAIAALLLASCASVQTATGDTGGSATQYCWKESFVDEGTSMSCNWVASRKEACETTYRTALAKSAIASGPESAGRCNNGQWLVQVTLK
jgi:hypothetical protein